MHSPPNKKKVLQGRPLSQDGQRVGHLTQNSEEGVRAPRKGLVGVEAHFSGRSTMECSGMGRDPTIYNICVIEIM